MNNMEIAWEIVRNSIAMFFAIIQLILVTSFIVVIQLYIDMRSSKKAHNASFKKHRAMESWARTQGYVPPSDDEINKMSR